MSHAYRRQVLREATGPTEQEFATEGATLLVGFISPRRIDRLALYQRLTPVDDEYTRFEYLDALPVLVGDLVASVLRSNLSPEARMERTQRRVENRKKRQAKRQENRTQAAANALLRWFEENEGTVETLWTAPEEGAGFFFEATDDFTVRKLQAKAKAISKDPRYKSYYAVLPSAVPGKFLVAFLRREDMVPIDYQSAIALALETTKPNTTTRDDLEEVLPFERSTAWQTEAKAEPIEAEDLPAPVEMAQTEEGNIVVTPTDEDRGALFPPRSSGFGGAVGNIGDFFKNTFGPKKPEKIKKKIEKLKAQLAHWEAKLQEAEASEGLVIGNIYGSGGVYATSARNMMRRFSGDGGPDYGRYTAGGVYATNATSMMDRFRIGAVAPSMMRRFRRAEDQDYADAYKPGMFKDAEDVDYGDDDPPEMFVDAEDQHYADAYQPGMFRNAEAQDYDEPIPGPFRRAGVSGATDEEDEAEIRKEVLGQLMAVYKGMLEAGEMTPQAYEALVRALPHMDTEALEDELEDLLDEDDEDEAGSFASARISASPTMAGRNRTAFGGRRGRRRGRRGGRRGGRRMRRGMRRMRRVRRMRRRGGGGGGGGGGPQVIVIREGGGGGYDGGYADDGYGDGYGDEGGYDDYGGGDEGGYDDETEGLAGPQNMGRIYDLPRSPNGFVINYPVGRIE